MNLYAYLNEIFIYKEYALNFLNIFICFFTMHLLTFFVLFVNFANLFKVYAVIRLTGCYLVC